MTEKVTYRETKELTKTFTTAPRTRRHKCKPGHVRRTVNALMNSFFPTVRVSYNAVERRLKTRFDLCDPKTALNYLGRPSYKIEVPVSQTVRYKKSGTTLEKNHVFRRTMPAKDGYIALFDAAHLEVETPVNSASWQSWGPSYWVVCWHHEVQVMLEEASPLASPQLVVGECLCGSNNNSLSFNISSSHVADGFVGDGDDVDVDGRVSSSSTYGEREKTLENPCVKSVKKRDSTGRWLEDEERLLRVLESSTKKEASE